LWEFPNPIILLTKIKDENNFDMSLPHKAKQCLRDGDENYFNGVYYCGILTTLAAVLFNSLESYVLKRYVWLL